jgi:membrane protein YqaA with SNARE-associated domain
MLRQAYQWVTGWSETPYGGWALFILAFAESSCFPIPPDVLLVALAVGQPLAAFQFALICSLGSVLGGLAGYAIGFFAKCRDRATNSTSLRYLGFLGRISCCYYSDSL